MLLLRKDIGISTRPEIWGCSETNMVFREPARRDLITFGYENSCLTAKF